MLVAAWLQRWPLFRAASSPHLPPLDTEPVHCRCSTRGTQTQRKDLSCPQKVLGSLPQPQEWAQAHQPQHMCSCLAPGLLSPRMTAASPIRAFGVNAPVWGQDCSVPGTRAAAARADIWICLRSRGGGF